MRKHIHSYWLPSVIFAGLVMSLSVALLAIGARSPYVHSNRNDAPISDYDRTEQTLVGPAHPLDRNSISVDSSAPLDAQGAELFIGLNCASCHGLKGQGQIVGPTIAGTNAATLAEKTSTGAGGMPAFANLTQDDLDALAAYLKSVTSSAATGN